MGANTARGTCYCGIAFGDFESGSVKLEESETKFLRARDLPPSRKETSSGGKGRPWDLAKGQKLQRDGHKPLVNVGNATTINGSRMPRSDRIAVSRPEAFRSFVSARK